MTWNRLSLTIKGEKRNGFFSAHLLVLLYYHMQALYYLNRIIQAKIYLLNNSSYLAKFYLIRLVWSFCRRHAVQEQNPESSFLQPCNSPPFWGHFEIWSSQTCTCNASRRRPLVFLYNACIYSNNPMHTTYVVYLLVGMLREKVLHLQQQPCTPFQPPFSK